MSLLEVCEYDLVGLNSDRVAVNTMVQAELAEIERREREAQQEEDRLLREQEDQRERLRREAAEAEQAREELVRKRLMLLVSFLPGCVLGVFSYILWTTDLGNDWGILAQFLVGFGTPLLALFLLVFLPCRADDFDFFR